VFDRKTYDCIYRQTDVLRCNISRRATKNNVVVASSRCFLAFNTDPFNSSYPLRCLSRRRFDPIQVAYNRCRPDGRLQPAPLIGFSHHASTTEIFKGFMKYYNCSHRAHGYAALAVSSPAVADTISSTHCIQPRGTARLSGPEWPG